MKKIFSFIMTFPLLIILVGCDLMSNKPKAEVTNLVVKEANKANLSRGVLFASEQSTANEEYSIPEYEVGTSIVIEFTVKVSYSKTILSHVVLQIRRNDNNEVETPIVTSQRASENEYYLEKKQEKKDGDDYFYSGRIVIGELSERDKDTVRYSINDIVMEGGTSVEFDNESTKKITIAVVDKEKPKPYFDENKVLDFGTPNDFNRIYYIVISEFKSGLKITSIHSAEPTEKFYKVFVNGDGNVPSLMSLYDKEIRELLVDKEYWNSKWNVDYNTLASTNTII